MRGEGGKRGREGEGARTRVTTERSVHLIVRDEDELEYEQHSNDGWLAVVETKTCVHIFLFHEVSKHGQGDEYVDLQITHLRPLTVSELLPVILLAV